MKNKFIVDVYQRSFSESLQASSASDFILWNFWKHPVLSFLFIKL